MAEQDIIVRVKAEGTEAFIKQLKAAGVQVEKVGDEAEEAEKKVEKSTSAMSSSFKKVGRVIAAAFATQQISQFIKESVKLADIQLKAEAQLLKGLKGRQDVQKRLIQQAKELQKVTTFGDEQIIAQQAYLANLEFTEKQIKDIIRASVDLSAGANIPLESSVRNLAKSYSGLSGELGELIPQLRDLTQDQLKNGEGVKVITELYEGQAEVLRNTGLGAVQSLQNAVGDLQEELGKAVLEGLIPLANTLQDISENENVLAFFRNIGVVLSDALQAAGFALEVVARLGGDLADLFNISDSQTGNSVENLNEQLSEEERLLQNALNARAEYNRVRGKERAEIEARLQAGEILSAAEVDTLRRLQAEKEAIESSISLREKQVSSVKSIISARERQANLIEGLITPIEDLNEKQEEQIELVIESENAWGGLETAYRSFVGSASDVTLYDGIVEQLERLSATAALVGLNLAGGISEAVPVAEDAADKIVKTQEEIRAEQVAKAQAGFSAFRDLQAGAFQAFSAFQQAELAELDRRLELGLISEKEYDKEKRNLQRKQARADKANAIFSATINTATAVTQALTQIGRGGLVLAAIAAASGAAQIAAIAKTPIPKFRKGTRMVGDGFELGEDRTLAYLNKGERVITADKNKKHFGLYNAIEDGDVDGMLKEMAKIGIAVQFNAGDALSGKLEQMKTLSQIKGNQKPNKIDLNPLLNASDRQRVTLSRKLDQVNGNLIKLGNSLGRRMTQA